MSSSNGTPDWGPRFTQGFNDAQGPPRSEDPAYLRGYRDGIRDTVNDSPAHREQEQAWNRAMEHQMRNPELIEKQERAIIRRKNMDTVKSYGGMVIIGIVFVIILIGSLLNGFSLTFPTP